jgi:hypothetical protein
MKKPVKSANDMSKKESYKEILVCLLDEFLKTGNDKEVKEYLASNSSLPGPREIWNWHMHSLM